MTNKSVYAPIAKDNNWIHRLPKDVSAGILTESDANLIKSYLTWKMSDNGISGKRQTKLYHSITRLRMFAGCAFAELDDTAFRSAVIGVRSHDYADWTKSDIIGQSKAFCRWAIAQGAMPNLSLTAVEGVKTPKAPKITKTPAELPTIDEIYTIMQHPACGVQLQALLATAFWSGARISEMLRLNWSDLVFSAHHVTLRIRDTKTQKIRSVPCYHESLYQMDIGTLMITVCAQRVFFDITPAGGMIDLIYGIDIENSAASIVDYHLDIRAK